MRPLILVLIPIVLFAGALLTAADSKPVEKHLVVPEPSPSIQLQPVSVLNQEPETAKPVQAPAILQPSAPPAPAPILVSVSKCTNAAGTEAYETDEGLQVKIDSERAQCERPVAILKDGKKYFGCPSGKIILDCDWFVETPGAETTTENAVFGNSYVVDFTVPDTSGLSCSDAFVSPEELAHVGGNVCDLQRLVGNLNQMHGG